MGTEGCLGSKGGGSEEEEEGCVWDMIRFWVVLEKRGCFGSEEEAYCFVYVFLFLIILTIQKLDLR